ncbi:MAG: methyltransferase domain-containing protein, partial [Pseudomonadales bacterium]
MISALTPEAQAQHQAIGDWFKTPLGQHLLQTEQAILEELLPGFFGYHLAQFSVQERELFQSSQIQHKLPVNLALQTSSGLVATPTQLPLASDSVDVALIHHLLDFVAEPEASLREIARVTIPMGHLVIVGFNPLSLWGAWQPYGRMRGRLPWTGSFIRPGRLMDWLNLLNFKIDRAQFAIYAPPLERYAGRVGNYSRGLSRNLN